MNRRWRIKDNGEDGEGKSEKHACPQTHTHKHKFLFSVSYRRSNREHPDIVMKIIRTLAILYSSHGCQSGVQLMA
jgi:hypothetical protein